MLSKKELALLEALWKHSNEYLSSQSLAKVIGVTDRTTRKYLQNIMSVVSQNGAEIVSKQGYGYCLTIFDERLFEHFWQKSMQSRQSLTDISQLETTEDRQRYILKKLFFEEPVLSVAQLLKELFVSKTTLIGDLGHVKSLLEPYGLKLEHVKKMLSIKGSEASIRRFIKSYFVDDCFEESLLATLSPSFLTHIDFGKLMLVVLEECRRERLRLSDFVIHNLVLHIALMIERIRVGGGFWSFETDSFLTETLEYQVACRILSRVESLVGVGLPLEEASYIALHLNIKNPLSNVSENAVAPKRSLKAQLVSVIEEVGYICQCDLVGDQLLLEGLLVHFNPLLTRLKHNIYLSNPLLEDIMQKYPNYFQMTKSSFAKLPELSGKSISDDEWAYIALHLIAAIERQKNRCSKRVLVVCATGYGSAMMLKSRLETEFASSLNIVDVLSYNEVTESCLHHIDLIVSSLNLPDHLFLTPVINVSVFLPPHDVDLIRAFLDEELGLSQDNPKRAVCLNHNEQCLSLFSPGQFLLVEDSLSRSSLLNDMIKRLKGIDDECRDDFQKQVDLREGYSSVVYEKSLAFPHPVKAMGEQEEVVVAVCPSTIKWDDNHGEVAFIFLLSPAKHRNERLKHLSACLVDFVADKTLQDRLLENPTYEEMLAIFKLLLTK